MENNFNVDNLSTFAIDKLKQINNCENELLKVSQQVGINNRLEIYDAELIEKYIQLKNDMKTLTYNFLY